MVASQAVMKQGQDGSVPDMAATMQAHAASGNWEKVEEIAARLRSAITAVPAQQRREALLAAQSSILQVQALAQSARSDVTEKLSAIRRGKDATRAYAGTE